VAGQALGDDDSDSGGEAQPVTMVPKAGKPKEPKAGGLEPEPSA